MYSKLSGRAIAGDYFSGYRRLLTAALFMDNLYAITCLAGTDNEVRYTAGSRIWDSLRIGAEVDEG